MMAVAFEVTPRATETYHPSKALALFESVWREAWESNTHKQQLSILNYHLTLTNIVIYVS